MTLQHCIVILFVVMSVAYMTYRAWKAFRKASDPCHGCPGCALKDLRKGVEKGMKPPCEGTQPPFEEKKE
ncbi:MAG: FeoB-associated Cys-rich membrane protein [Prevotella sp.]|nr:FeoB-associated Cys-rich membrane protein [Prevotella sp.]